MRLVELQNQYELFVDLDGVLANFAGAAEREFGYDCDAVDPAILWKDISNWEKMGKKWGYKWYRDLDLLPDAMQLWLYIQKYNPAILSATGHSIKDAGQQKEEWVRQHIPGNPKVHIVTYSGHKANQYASENRILIDDSERSINPWRRAGGIGILHTSATDTIRQLQELGL